MHDIDRKRPWHKYHMICEAAVEWAGVLLETICRVMSSMVLRLMIYCLRTLNSQTPRPRWLHRNIWSHAIEGLAIAWLHISDRTLCDEVPGLQEAPYLGRYELWGG